MEMDDSVMLETTLWELSKVVYVCVCAYKDNSLKRDFD